VQLFRIPVPNAVKAALVTPRLISVTVDFAPVAGIVQFYNVTIRAHSFPASSALAYVILSQTGNYLISCVWRVVCGDAIFARGHLLTQRPNYTSVSIVNVV